MEQEGYTKIGDTYYKLADTSLGEINDKSGLIISNGSKFVVPEGTALITLQDGTEYKMTTKKWLSPKGNWINEKGIEPDIKLELDENYYKNPSYDTDNQLQGAINYLIK